MLTLGISTIIQANKSTLSIKFGLLACCRPVSRKSPCVSYVRHLGGVEGKGPRLAQYGLHGAEGQDRRGRPCVLFVFLSRDRSLVGSLHLGERPLFSMDCPGGEALYN